MPLPGACAHHKCVERQRAQSCAFHTHTQSCTAVLGALRFASKECITLVTSCWCPLGRKVLPSLCMLTCTSPLLRWMPWLQRQA